MKLVRQILRLRVVRGLLVTAFWVGVWEILVLAVGQPLLLPGPVSVLRRLGELLATEQFYRVTATSLLHILSGFLLATLGAILLAALTARLPLARTLLHPVMAVIKATPVASFIILAILWMGSSRVPAFITALIVLPVIWTNLDIGYGTVDKGLLELTQAYRFSPWRRARYLILPTLRPYFVSAMRTSIGLAWKAGIAAEILATPRNSIGAMIKDSKDYLETATVFAWTLTVVLLSLVIEFFVATLLKRWQDPLDGRKEAV